jgi:dsRNA-specific ribonuclease
MLIFTLTQSEPSNLEYQKMRDEMERMRFLGDQIVSTATVTALYMAHRGGITEREFD